MYSISQYSEMIADGVRMDAYARALRAAVKPGDVVLDIGTGTGAAAVLACRFGARRVYAIEPSDAIFVAREVAAANGVSDRIEFIQELSTEVELAERANVIVSDLRGVLPVFERHLVAIADARSRHLAPGGTLIPESDSLWTSVVAAPGLHASIASAWGEDTYGLDLGPARRLAVNTICKVKGHPVDLLGPAVAIGDVDYRTVDDPAFRGAVTQPVERGGLAHGLCVWFDSVLHRDITLSNAPNRPALVYGQAFFPWPDPIELQRGDRVTVSLAADVVGQGYLWRWDTRIIGADSALRAEFRQSELAGEMLSPASLRRRSSEHVPLLNEDGGIDALVLQLMQAAMPLGEIARALARRYPARFARWEDALTRVGDLSVRYSR